MADPIPDPTTDPVVPPCPPDCDTVTWGTLTDDAKKLLADAETEACHIVCTIKEKGAAAGAALSAIITGLWDSFKSKVK